MAESYRAEYVKCGKRGCQSCPHGPYWYGYTRIKGKLHKRYYGKVNPKCKEADKKVRERHPWDDIFAKKTATPTLASVILGNVDFYDNKKCKQAFRKLTMEHHPDRGGDELVYKRIVAAWTFRQAYLGNK